MSREPRTDRIEGDGLLVAAGPLREKLRAALARGGSLTLDLSGIEAADVSFVQLLVSAALTAERAGQTLTLARPSSALCVAFQRAGVGVDPAAGRILFNRGS